MSTPNHDTELEEILKVIFATHEMSGAWLDAIKDIEKVINTYLYKQTLELIGDDVPINVGGKQIKHGDPMMIDLSGGTDGPIFRESCKNIQENGRNLEKAQLRKAAAERWGQE